jgi:hypothetical protein
VLEYFNPSFANSESSFPGESKLLEDFISTQARESLESLHTTNFCDSADLGQELKIVRYILLATELVSLLAACMPVAAQTTESD